MLQSPISVAVIPNVHPQHAGLVDGAVDLDLLDRFHQRLGRGRERDEQRVPGSAQDGI